MKGRGLALVLALSLIVSGLQGNTVYAGRETKDAQMGDVIEDVDPEDEEMEDEELEDDEPQDDEPDNTVTDDSGTLVTGDDGFLKDGVFYQTFDSSCNWKDIQTAFDHTKNGTAEKVEITLKGQIQVKGRLIVYSNTTIHANDAVITQKGSGSSILKSATAEDYGPVAHYDGYRSTQNIKILGGTWNGMKKSGQVIRFVHATNVFLEGLTVSGCTTSGHLITFEGVDTGTIHKCTLIGHSGMGNIKEAIHLDIVHSQKTTPGLFNYEYDDLPDRNISIRNNIIVDSANGVGSHAAVDGVYHQNISIVGNVFRNIRNTSIRLYNYKNVLVSQNSISNSGTGIRCYTLLTSGYLANNGVKTEPIPKNHNYNIIIRQNWLASIKSASAIYALGSARRPIYNLKIERNSINGAVLRGIRVSDYCVNTSVTWNAINNAFSGGIVVEGTSNGSSIERNTVSGCGSNGITVSGTIRNVKVRNNTVKSSKGNGILINDRAMNTVVSGNKVSGAKKSGILVSSYSKKATVKNNTIKGNIKQHGISVSQNASARMEKNSISSAQQDGIHLSQNSEGTIRKNTINKVKNHGIYAHESSLSDLESNKINRAGKNGILLSNSEGCNLSRNTVSRATMKGIQISSAKTPSTVSKNTVKDSGDSGIYVYDSKKTEIKGNRISNAKGRGINLGNGGKGCKITENTVVNTREEGISSYKSAEVSIMDNTVINARDAGISAGCAGKTVKVSRNRISDIKGTGITIWTTKKAVIEKNVLQNVGKVAFRINRTKSKVKTTSATKVNHVTKKKKVVSGKAREGSKYSVSVGKKNYKAKVENGSFKSAKIKKIKKGTEVKIVEKIAGGNQIQTVVKVRK